MATAPCRRRLLRAHTFEHFESRAALIDGLLVSSYVPGVMKPPRLHVGPQMVDGGIWPLVGGSGTRTISVSPFGGAFDVSPSSHTGYEPLVRLPIGGGWLDASMANVEAAKLAAQPAPELETLYRAGFDDCHRFLRIECPGIAIAPYGSEPA